MSIQTTISAEVLAINKLNRGDMTEAEIWVRFPELHVYLCTSCNLFVPIMANDDNCLACVSEKYEQRVRASDFVEG